MSFEEKTSDQIRAILNARAVLRAAGWREEKHRGPDMFTVSLNRLYPYPYSIDWESDGNVPKEIAKIIEDLGISIEGLDSLKNGSFDRLTADLKSLNKIHRYLGGLGKNGNPSDEELDRLLKAREAASEAKFSHDENGAFTAVIETSQDPKIMRGQLVRMLKNAGQANAKVQVDPKQSRITITFKDRNAQESFEQYVQAVHLGVESEPDTNRHLAIDVLGKDFPDDGRVQKLPQNRLMVFDGSGRPKAMLSFAYGVEKKSLSEVQITTDAPDKVLVQCYSRGGVKNDEPLLRTMGSPGFVSLFDVAKKAEKHGSWVAM